MSVLLENVRRRKSHRMAHEIFVLLPPPLAWLGWLLVIGFFCTVCYLAVVQVAKKERVTGVLSALSDTVGVSVPKSAIIDKILVSEGQTVAAWQPLFVLREQSYTGHHKGSVESGHRARVEALIRTQDAALQSLSQKHRQQHDHAVSQVSLINRQLLSLREQINTVSSRLALAQTQLEKTTRIEKRGYTSEIEINRQRDNVLMFRQEIGSLQQEESRQQALSAAAQSHLDELPFAQQAEQTALQSALHRLRTELLDLQKKNAQTVVSPVAGVIDHIRLQVGQDVKPGVSYVKVVPEQSTLQLVLYAPASAAVFVAPEQRVLIRYRDFPYQRFGHYEGTVLRISRSPVMPGEPSLIALNEPSYAIDVNIDSPNVRAYGKEFSLRPGMVADVDVITERRSLLYWLFEPVLTLSGMMK